MRQKLQDTLPGANLQLRERQDPDTTEFMIGVQFYGTGEVAKNLIDDSKGDALYDEVERRAIEVRDFAIRKLGVPFALRVESYASNHALTEGIEYVHFEVRTDGNVLIEEKALKRLLATARYEFHEEMRYE